MTAQQAFYLVMFSPVIAVGLVSLVWWGWDW